MRLQSVALVNEDEPRWRCVRGPTAKEPGRRQSQCAGTKDGTRQEFSSVVHGAPILEAAIRVEHNSETQPPRKGRSFTEGGIADEFLLRPSCDSQEIVTGVD